MECDGRVMDEGRRDVERVVKEERRVGRGWGRGGGVGNC
jgi:hypothetical protein